MPIPGCPLKAYVMPRSEMMNNESKKANKNKNSANNNVYAMKPCRKKKS